MKVATLQDVLVEQLRDLLDAEKQLVKALPKMARSADDSELEMGFREHLEVTKEQVNRLEQVFGILDMRARSKPCAGMKGLVEEGNEVQQEDFAPGLRDTALQSAGRRVEHYEIAAYSSAMEMAQQAGLREAAQMLQQTLKEEMDMERKLSQIAKRLLKDASRMGREAEKTAGRAEARASSRTAARSATSRSRSAPAKGSRKHAARGSQRNAGGSAQPLIDHDQIRNWAEERGAHPASVKGTGGGSDTGMIRLDFPGWTGEESLEPISWDDWFKKFDDSNLALLVQERTGKGEKSNFNKLVSRESVEAKGSRPKTKHAGGR